MLKCVCMSVYMLGFMAIIVCVFCGVYICEDKFIYRISECVGVWR